MTDALEHATTRWHEINTRIGDAADAGSPRDPYLYAALLDARAGWWNHLGHLADQAAGVGLGRVRDVYAIACSYAAELDRTAAAETRFRHRIPTLHPGSDAARLGLSHGTGRHCDACGRPWQYNRHQSCGSCPDLLWGITPHSAEQAKTYPPGEQWVPGPDRTEDDGD